MKKLRILCDADDTIENLTTHWLDVLNSRYNRNVKKEELKIWDMTAAFPDLKPEEVLEPLYCNEFWERITPIDNSGYYLERLMNEGHELYVVTASIPETFNAKVKKLLNMFPFLNRNQIILAHNKQQISGDVLIDDAVHNLIGGSYIKFLYHQPNNASFNEYVHDITRVFSWEDVYCRIQSLSEQAKEEQHIFRPKQLAHTSFYRECASL